MKYILLVLLVLVVGCNDEPEDIKRNIEKTTQVLHLEEIDGCEYILFYGVNKGGIVHHGNCHNPVHGVKSWGTVTDVDSVPLIALPGRGYPAPPSNCNCP